MCSLQEDLVYSKLRLILSSCTKCMQLFTVCVAACIYSGVLSLVSWCVSMYWQTSRCSWRRSVCVFHSQLWWGQWHCQALKHTWQGQYTYMLCFSDSIEKIILTNWELIRINHLCNPTRLRFVCLTVAGQPFKFSIIESSEIRFQYDNPHQSHFYYKISLIRSRRKKAGKRCGL